MQVGKLTGFLPYKLLDPSRLNLRKSDGSLAPPPARGHQELLGQPVRVKITQVGAGHVRRCMFVIMCGKEQASQQWEARGAGAAP